LGFTLACGRPYLRGEASESAVVAVVAAVVVGAVAAAAAAVHALVGLAERVVGLADRVLELSHLHAHVAQPRAAAVPEHARAEHLLQRAAHLAHVVLDEHGEVTPLDLARDVLEEPLLLLVHAPLRLALGLRLGLLLVEPRREELVHHLAEAAEGIHREGVEAPALR